VVIDCCWNHAPNVCVIELTNQSAHKLEHLPQDTEMFAPTIICILDSNRQAFQAPMRFFLDMIFFSENDENIPYFSPATKYEQFQPLLKSFSLPDAN